MTTPGNAVLRNAGNTCFVSSILHSLSHCSAIIERYVQGSEDPAYLQQLLRYVWSPEVRQTINIPEILYSLPMVSGEQQDPAEFLVKLLESNDFNANCLQQFDIVRSLRYYCAKCPYDGCNDEVLRALDLHIGADLSNCSLQDCIELTLNTLDETTQCKSCGQSTKVSSQELTRTSAILVLSLNRQHNGKRISTEIACPNSLIICNQQYELVSCIEHINLVNGTSSGHYVACVKNASNGYFYHFDDLDFPVASQAKCTPSRNSRVLIYQLVRPQDEVSLMLEPILASFHASGFPKPEKDLTSYTEAKKAQIANTLHDASIEFTKSAIASANGFRIQPLIALHALLQVGNGASVVEEAIEDIDLWTDTKITLIQSKYISSSTHLTESDDLFKTLIYAAGIFAKYPAEKDSVRPLHYEYRTTGEIKGDLLVAWASKTITQDHEKLAQLHIHIKDIIRTKLDNTTASKQKEEYKKRKQELEKKLLENPTCTPTKIQRPKIMQIEDQIAKFKADIAKHESKKMEKEKVLKESPKKTVKAQESVKLISKLSDKISAAKKDIERLQMEKEELEKGDPQYQLALNYLDSVDNFCKFLKRFTIIKNSETWHELYPATLGLLNERLQKLWNPGSNHSAKLAILAKLAFCHLYTKVTSAAFPEKNSALQRVIDSQKEQLLQSNTKLEAITKRILTNDNIDTELQALISDVSQVSESFEEFQKRHMEDLKTIANIELQLKYGDAEAYTSYIRKRNSLERDILDDESVVEPYKAHILAGFSSRGLKLYQYVDDYLGVRKRKRQNSKLHSQISQLPPKIKSLNLTAEQEAIILEVMQDGQSEPSTPSYSDEWE